MVTSDTLANCAHWPQAIGARSDGHADALLDSEVSPAQHGQQSVVSALIAF